MAAIDNINKSAFLYGAAITPQIVKICEPLKSININKFGYFRFFKNYTLFGVTNQTSKYYENYFTHILPYKKVFVRNTNEYIKDGYSYFLWPKKIGKDDYLSLNHEFNFWQGLTVYYRTQKYIEAFSFTFDRNSNDKTNFFLNNIKLFNNFCNHFRHSAKELIDCSDKSRLATYKKNLCPNLFDNRNSQETNNIQKVLNRLNTPANFVPTKLLCCSDQENNCVHLLSQGKTMKEAGRILNISPRTVESYIESIKRKTGCHFKSQIIDLFWKNQFLKE